MSSRSSGWRVDLERNFISITTNFEALGRADESPGCVVGGCAALTGITQQSLSQEGVREAEAWEDPGSLAFILGTALGWGKEIQGSSWALAARNLEEPGSHRHL